MKDKYKVYVKTDDKGRITAINSDAFLSTLDGWIEVDSGKGDKYHHAQANYLGTLFDDRGLFLYELRDGKVKKRKKEDIEADYIPPIVLPTLEERLAALEKGLAFVEKFLGAIKE